MVLKRLQGFNYELKLKFFSGSISSYFCNQGDSTLLYPVKIGPQILPFSSVPFHTSATLVYILMKPGTWKSRCHLPLVLCIRQFSFSPHPPPPIVSSFACQITVRVSFWKRSLPGNCAFCIAVYCSIKQILLFNSLCVLTFLRNTNFSFRVFLYRSENSSDARILPCSQPRLLSYPGLTTLQFYLLWPSLVSYLIQGWLHRSSTLSGLPSSWLN